MLPDARVPTYPFWDMRHPAAWLELYRSAVEIPLPARTRGPTPCAVDPAPHPAVLLAADHARPVDVAQET